MNDFIKVPVEFESHKFVLIEKNEYTQNKINFVNRFIGLQNSKLYFQQSVAINWRDYNIEAVSKFCLNQHEFQLCDVQIFKPFFEDFDFLLNGTRRNNIFVALVDENHIKSATDFFNYSGANSCLKRFNNRIMYVVEY